MIDAFSQTNFSTAAQVTVLPDTQPPVIAGAELNTKSNRLSVTFSEKVQASTAVNATHYVLNNGVTLGQAELAADGRTVTLVAAGLAAGQTGFVLNVSGVTDRFDNAILTSPVSVNLTWTETFNGGPGYFTLKQNNPANGNDLGYSFSVNAGGNIGEIGGAVVRTTTAAAALLGDPTLGAPISLTNDVVFRGQLYLRNINANGNLFFGYVPNKDSLGSSLGLQLAEPNSSFAPNFRGQLQAAGASTPSALRFPVPPEGVVNFNLAWKADAGVWSGNVGSQQVAVTNGPSSREYATLVIAALGANSINAAQNTLIYLDNLTYSVGAVRTPPDATGPTLGVTLNQPLAGQIYLPGESVTLQATALTADLPVTKVEFFAQPKTGGQSVKIGEAAAAPYTATWNAAGQGSYDLTARVLNTAAAAVTSAPVTILVVIPAPVGVVTEPFPGTLNRFQFQRNNHAATYDFGFSGTLNAGGDLTGEAGGLFVRDPLPAYVADTNIGNLYPRLQNLALSGKLYLQNNNFNGGLFVGYANGTNLNSRFGLSLNEPGGNSGGAFRAAVVLGAASSAAINVPDVTAVTFALEWSATNGTLTGTVAGQPVTLVGVPLTEVFDTLLIGTIGNATSIPSAQASFFVDDISYTVAIPVPHLQLKLVNGQVVLTWDQPGYKLQQRASLTSGQWSDAVDPVTVGNGVYSVTLTPSGQAQFWQLSPQ